jgi:hypothetical protein
VHCPLVAWWQPSVVGLASSPGPIMQPRRRTYDIILPCFEART